MKGAVKSVSARLVVRGVNPTRFSRKTFVVNVQRPASEKVCKVPRSPLLSAPGSHAV